MKLSTKYVFNGRFKVHTMEAFESPLEVYLSEHSISVCPQMEFRREELRVLPFHGRMFFDLHHNDGREIVKNQYQLVMSGTRLGFYAYGGGADGEFDVYRIKEVEIRGTFNSLGLQVEICARTHRGEAVCYSAGTCDKTAYEPIHVEAEFLVPPQHLPAFLDLQDLSVIEAFCKFNGEKH